ncbi:MAG: MBL fold metallo-hydrolase [Coriobacteriales bacterium]|jgi:glyoxylase-like metal-dependent hydrolase (beta-lactamase superfamily II)|nr:MBL fold metallo-hydrolase [Coriobacteriales bacterium]
MRVFETGTLSIDKLGAPGGDAYMVMTPERSLLYDSGFAYWAPSLVTQLEKVLAGRALDYLFLSHSHYDHASGSVWIQERWPEALVVASAHAARVFERPGARATMQTLSRAAASEAVRSGLLSVEAAEAVDYALLDRLAVDEIVADGSVIDLGSAHLEVVESPGHTRCSLMLWCPEEKLLFGSESLGVMMSETMVQPVCLTGYHDSLASLARAQALEPEHILVSHQQVLSGEDAARYLSNARHWTEKTAHLVWECDAVGMSKASIAALLKEIFYSEALRGFQPEAAFDLNTGYLIDQLLASKE